MACRYVTRRGATFGLSGCPNHRRLSGKSFGCKASLHNFQNIESLRSCICRRVYRRICRIALATAVSDSEGLTRVLSPLVSFSHFPMLLFASVVVLATRVVFRSLSFDAGPSKSLDFAFLNSQDLPSHRKITSLWAARNKELSMP